MTPRAVVQILDLELEGLRGVIACYVISTTVGYVLIDPGPSRCLPSLERGLQRLGKSWDQLEAILLTHCHLDHAGVTGELAERSGAPVFVHRAGVSHLREPERLLASAARLWGEGRLTRLFGGMRPVAEHQVAEAGNGRELVFGGCRFFAWETPGHAQHHLCWQLEDHLFTGDVAGVQIAGSTRVVAPVPPPDLDFEAWRRSLDTIRSLDPGTLWLSHFGPTPAVAGHLEDLERELDELEALAVAHRDDEAALDTALRQRRDAWIRGLPTAQAQRIDAAAPVEIDGPGLLRWADRNLTLGT